MRNNLPFLAVAAVLLSAAPAARAIVLYETDFGTDPATDGWTTTGWQWGVASGGCFGGEPDLDHTPTTDNCIYASELGACYTNNMPVEYLVSPTFDFTGLVGVHLGFWRWLGVENASYDHAGIDQSTDGGSTWSSLWDHSGDGLEDTAWTEFAYVLIGTDNLPAVNIRFRMGPTDMSVVYGGFNIDDLSVYTIDPFCVDLDPLQSDAGASTGDQVVHPFTVINCGSNDSEIILAVSGFVWPTQVTDTSGAPISSINVPAQSTAAIQVRVTVGSEGSDMATLTASCPGGATNVQATVTTSRILYFNDFATDPADDGWTGCSSGQWEWGPATASIGCYGHQDPATDHTGTADDNIIGYNIAGCYTNSMGEVHLSSPPFDFSGLMEVHLSFWRLLGVGPAVCDHAAVEGSNDGSTWETIWEHTGTSFWDTIWTEVTYDLSAIADGQAAFQVRFVMGPTDSTMVYCGWNIDDLGFTGIPPSYLEGAVLDDLGPIEGAVVSLDGTAYEAETNASGFYHLAAPAGTYDVTATATGHNPAQAAGVALLTEQTTTQDFVLTYPEIVVTPAALNVELDYGDIETRNLTIQNTGNGPLEWSITYGTADRGPEALAVDATWFSADPESGTVAPGGSTIVVTTFDSTQVEGPGTYQTALMIHSNDGDEPEVLIDVELVVTSDPPTAPPTPSPTPTATPEVTPSPEPTATPAFPLGVRIEMPVHARPGETFSVTGWLDNPGPVLAYVPTVFVLDVWDQYYFWPTWCQFWHPHEGDIDYSLVAVPVGSTRVEVVAPFVWPDCGTDEVDGLLFWGAMLTDDLRGIRGEFDLVAWGYGPP